MTKRYFAHPTDTYDKRIESDCLKLIIKTFPGAEMTPEYKTFDEYIIWLKESNSKDLIVNPKLLFKTIEKEANKLTGKKREKFIFEYMKLALKECDTIVYTNTFTRKKNINFPKGVREEVNYGLRNKYKILRIYLCGHNGDIETAQVKKIQEINNDYINQTMRNDFNKYTIESQDWVLKSTADYTKFYEKNPSAIKLMQKWFTDVEHIGTGCIASHFSHLSGTNNRNDLDLVNCREHFGMKHATIVPDSQLYDTVCPYFSSRKFSPGYATNKLFLFPTDKKEITNLITKSRVIHKFWDIFDSKTNLTYGGIALRDENGGLIKNKSGKYIADTRLIKGVRPLVDIDIKAEIKSKYNFFSEEIFREYGLAIDKLLNYLDSEEVGNRCRLQFSGNGMYIELEPMDFTKEDTTYDEFEMLWSGNDILEKINKDKKDEEKIKPEMEKMQKILDDAGIKYLTLEAYSWNQYFKLPMSFHASKERISIPLNKDESFDSNVRKYIDEMSSVKRGLNENICDEIIRNAGNEWK